MIFVCLHHRLTLLRLSPAPQLLEAFLPDSASQLASLVRVHMHAGEHHEFSVAQILGIAGMSMVGVLGEVGSGCI